MVITNSKNKDQPGKVANPARGQLAEQEKEIIPCPRSRLRIWSCETGSAVPSRVSLLISILRLNLVLTYGIPPEFRGGVHSLSVHIMCYQVYINAAVHICTNYVPGRPGSSEVPRNPLTRWDVSSIPPNGIFFTKKLKN